MHDIPYDCVYNDRLKRWGLFSRVNTLKYTQAVACRFFIAQEASAHHCIYVRGRTQP